MPVSEPLTARHTATDVIAAHPPCARVLQEAGIDACCRGHEPLGEVCARLGLDVDWLLGRLEAARERASLPQVDPRTLPPGELMARLVSSHHPYLRETLPHLSRMAARVARVHGERDPRLEELKTTFDDLSWLLLAHLDHEEEHLFPALLDERPGQAWGLVARMRREHEDLRAVLSRLRALSDGHRPPSWACTTYRALLAELARLEADMLLHIHAEDRVLTAPDTPDAPAPRGDALEELDRDHEAILRLLELLERACAAPARLALVRRALELLTRFADQGHHAKEERCLFPALHEAGFPREVGPVAVMLHEHEAGRAAHRTMEAALDAAETGGAGAADALRQSVAGYCQHLRQHIAKEDQVLFPMARQVLPPAVLQALGPRCQALAEQVLGPAGEAGARAEVEALAGELASR